VDFKESAEWKLLRWRIIKTLMAMGNVRDGGIIVVGASERGDEWDLAGIHEAHLRTYDVDEIMDALAKYASPPIEAGVVLVEYRNDKSFLAFHVREFEHSPYICKANCPDGVGLFKEGDIFVRPPGKAQTKKVTNAQDLADLLELAAERRARRMIETAHRIGFVPSPSAAARFDRELGEL
jgi:hypothetical protein